ncbi:peptidoglycan-binding protein [Rhizobium sp. L1K21]|uniref:peptidoglycan-binding domain-containing protein n=1 Tax=Rhizobium sp. L1K21 TaxID=2954933 RepID=UPI002092A926|nr:peptidoglycan-binding protein [Rhizobium sp. L1K21]MCO6186720.1 peptidoglycan-binding protein [Rhizobium sp. L1K21]
MPKRKAPDKKRARRSWLMSGVAAVASLAMSRPGVSGGTMVFGIIFSFVAANALWYQPKHPHPMLDTRSAFSAYVARAAAIAEDEDNVTTFRIERQNEAPKQDAPTTTAVRATKPSTVGDIIVLDDTLAGNLPAAGEASELVRQIQQNLTRRGLYDGTIDGLMGPQTEAAITFYQQTRGIETNGEPSISVLNALKADNAEFAVVPPDRPQPEITNAIAAKPPAADDGVAALIEANWTPPVPVMRPERAANVPQAEQKPVAAAPEPTPVVLTKPATPETKKQPAAAPTLPVVNADPELVKSIQQGLSNLAYADISIDGVAGAQTQTAISHFQKHYRLPVTGKPDELVLEKLKQIGAL